MNKITRIPFHGTEIVAALVDGEPYVAVKPVCDSLGIQWEAQYKRLQRQPWAGVSITDMVAADGKERQMSVVDRRTFTMWLATIETSRIKNEEAKNLLIAYQKEAADALDKYFHEGGAINPNATEHQINALVYQARAKVELLQAAKGLIHPDHLAAMAETVVARGIGSLPTTDAATQLLYTQDFLKQKNVSKSRLKSIAGMFGKRVKAAYVLKHGTDPEKYPLTLPNGQTRLVNGYTQADRPLLDEVWDNYYAAKLTVA